MIECFLHGHGSCGGKLSREHYISKTVLDAIGHNGVQVGGLAWQPNQTLQRIGIGSLVSKVLCETHNSGLTTLDREAGDLFRVLDAADKRRTSLPNITTFDGPDVERWFLKVICGLAAGPGLSNGTVPDVWKSVLSGNPWPDGWGLYLPLPLGANVLATEFSVETLVDPASMVVLAVRFRVAGIHFNLLLCRLDSPAAWGIHRPHGIVFREGQSEKRVEFTWPFRTDQVVAYTKVGASNDRPVQWDGWLE